MSETLYAHQVTGERRAAAGMTLSNKITIGRIFLVPVFVALLLYYRLDRDVLRWVAFGVFVTGVISDGLDGYLARRHGQRSPLGTLLDPIADKLLMTSAFLTLAISSTWPAEARIPPWVTIPVISRDMLLILGSIIIFLMTGTLTVKPSQLGKCTTAAQMASLIATLLLWPRVVLRVFWGVAVGLTVFSTIGYVRSGSRRLPSSGQPTESTAERAPQ